MDKIRQIIQDSIDTKQRLLEDGGLIDTIQKVSDAIASAFQAAVAEAIVTIVKTTDAGVSAAAEG